MDRPALENQLLAIAGSIASRATKDVAHEILIVAMLRRIWRQKLSVERYSEAPETDEREFRRAIDEETTSKVSQWWPDLRFRQIL